MAYRISRRLLTTCCGDYIFLCKSTHLVRPNASFIWHLCRPFSSEGLKIRSLAVYDNNILKEKHLADLAKLFRGHGFSDTDLSKMAKKCPSIVGAKQLKLLPSKLKFLESIGLSSTGLLKFVRRNPFVLAADFKKQVVPCYDYLKNLPLTNEHLLKILKCNPGILSTKVDTVIARNIDLLREKGVPNSYITTCLVRDPNPICRNHERFKTAVEQAMAMGLDPGVKVFVHALRVLCSHSKMTWDHKVKIFRRFGFSDDDVKLAFKRMPYVMAMSENKMEKVMGFFSEVLRWEPEVLACAPVILCMNFEKRVFPRYYVMEILKSKNLWKNASLVTILKLSEEQFLIRFIRRHEDVLPGLMNIYSEVSFSPRELDHPVHEG